MSDVECSDHDRVNALMINLAVLRAEVADRNALVDERSEAFFLAIADLKRAHLVGHKLLFSILAAVIVALASGLIALA